MKIFLDTAHLQTIKNWAATGLINGVTTNPSHLSKELTMSQIASQAVSQAVQNTLNIHDLIMEICRTLPDGEISVEVTEQAPEKVYEQAKQIAQLASNIVVKIPCHKDYYSVIKQLVAEDIPINITLVFSVLQGFMMCKLGVRYISPFVGRLDDIDENGASLLYDMTAMIRRYAFSTQLLAASIRDVRHLHCAIQASAHAATVPPAVLEKAVTHPLTQAGMEQFDNDWKKTGIKQFP